MAAAAKDKIITRIAHSSTVLHRACAGPELRLRRTGLADGPRQRRAACPRRSREIPPAGMSCATGAAKIGANATMTALGVSVCTHSPTMAIGARASCPISGRIAPRPSGCARPAPSAWRAARAARSCHPPACIAETARCRDGGAHARSRAARRVRGPSGRGDWRAPGRGLALYSPGAPVANSAASTHRRES